MRFDLWSYGLVSLPLAGVLSMRTEPTRSPKADAEQSMAVRSILKARCGSCHGAQDPSAGLNLTSDRAILASGIIRAGNAKASVLMHRVLGSDGKPRMPLGFSPLSAAELATLSKWIDSGANFVAAPKAHWAYVAPSRPSLPKVSDPGWCRNEIDRFVMGKLDQAQLKPSAQASRVILIRRVTLDLIGLPPSPAEVDRFLADRSPDAYEKVVDRLLCSPQYGERQARPWLDLARYADTNGYEADYSRTMWPYRDWVIDALNRNEPYDQFTVDQIAGDMRPNASLSQRVATGFNRNVMFNTEGGVDQGEQRWLRLVDMVGTTSQTWLGITLQCAQCHDHKYDPFSQKDFYKFLAFFESADTPTLELRPELNDERRRLKAEIQSRQDALKGLKESPEGAKQQLNDLKKKLEAISGPTVLSFAENYKVRPQTLLRIRGGYLSPGEKVDADTPKSLARMPDGLPKNRFGLARWLVSKRNPLTARVQVNRMWENLFGRGIVETSENFGTQGAVPSHPELLDWLATEFLRRNWDLKAMNKLMVMSATYRQSSATTAKLTKIDPQNVLLARGPRFRMEAEMVRDNALAISGLLSLKMGGPSVFPSQPDGVWDSPYSGETWQTSAGEDRYRRGIYTFWKRTATYPAFTVLDATSREGCTVRRIRTNTPLQALALLNDPMYLEAAKGLAKRMDREGGTSPRSKLQFGFRLCVSRRPTPKESDRLFRLYRTVYAKYAAKPELAKALGSDAEDSARILLANVLLNMDETISKE